MKAGWLPGVAALLVIGSVTSAFAQDILVPGGSTALKCAVGLPAGMPPSRALAELARRDGRMSSDAPARRYIDWLGEVQRRLRAGRSDDSLNARLADRQAQRVAEDVMEHLGFDLQIRDGRPQIRERKDETSLARAAYASCAGITLKALTDAVAAGEVLRILPAADAVPAFLPAASWARLPDMEGATASSLFASVIASNRALLFYYGLSRTDDATRAWLETQPALVKWLFEDAAARFAAFGHAIQWRNGALAVAGGPAGIAAWERALDRKIADPGAFVRALLERDDGRAAHLFATLRALPAETVNALVHPATFERLRDVFKSNASEWKVDEQPFTRPIADPAFALLMLAADGTPLDAGPPWERVWRAGLEEMPLSRTQSNLARDITRGDRVDIVWLIGAISAAGADPLKQLQLVRFARRMFPRVQIAQAGDVGVVLASFSRLQGLMLALERAGVREPAVLAQIAEAALKFAARDPQDAATPLVAWQSTVAYIAAASAGGGMPRDEALKRITDLAAVAPGDKGRWGLSLTRFFWEHLLPADASDDNPRSLDDAALALLTPRTSESTSEFEWEGLKYRSRVFDQRVTRARAIARAQPRASLDDILKIAGVVDALGAAKTLADVNAATTALSELQPRLPQALPALFLTNDDPLNASDAVARVVRELRKITRDRDAQRARRQIEPLTWLQEELYADTLPALLYASRLALGVGRPESLAELWRRHDYGFRATGSERDPFLAWRLPVINADQDGGFQVRGALAGFEMALGETWMRRLAGGAPPRPTRLSEANIETLARSLALLLTDPQAEPAFAPADRSCYCRDGIADVPADLLTGRGAVGSLLPLFSDLNDRVVEFAKSLGLPRELRPLMLAASYRDVLDAAEMAHPDDWESVLAFSRALSRDRLEEYVFALIGTRELGAVTRRP